LHKLTRQKFQIPTTLVYTDKKAQPYTAIIRGQNVHDVYNKCDAEVEYYPTNFLQSGCRCR